MLLNEVDFRRQLIEVQEQDAPLAREAMAAGLELDALVAFYRKELRAGLYFPPEELIRYAIKQSNLAQL
jgi:hypothetical protein